MNKSIITDENKQELRVGDIIVRYNGSLLIVEAYQGAFGCIINREFAENNHTLTGFFPFCNFIHFHLEGPIWKLGNNYWKLKDFYKIGKL